MELTKPIILKDKTLDMTLEEVVTQFQALVNKLLKRWTKKYEYDDLFQIGNIGLIKAYKNYNYENGTSFITYATYYISGQLSAHYRDDKSKNIITNSLNESILDKDSNEIEKITLLKDEATNVEETAINSLQYENIHNVLKDFSKDDKQVIQLYFIEHKKQTEIAKILNCTQAQISRKIKKILNKLKLKLS